MTDSALMVQGTASGVGKSLLVARLCRLLARSGVRVAPFKPQNMNNAAAACPGGGEIGRAQALQAFACGLEPTVDMNPVLVKPEADQTAQFVVSGEVRGRLHAGRFREERAPLLPEVVAAFERLAAAYDFRRTLLRHWLAWASTHTEDQTTRWRRDLDHLADTLRDDLDLALLTNRVGEVR